MIDLCPKHLIAAFLGALMCCAIVRAAEGTDDQSLVPVPTTQSDAVSTEPSGETPKKRLDVKNTFRNICGFCHENYGRRAAKGPQLMNSERSDEFLFNRIKNGMPGRMAAWSSIYDDDQIRLIVKFIRGLNPDQEPENP